jgi:putative ubiquitin-RnfH superfamily antitoxin RatB of RatAB toxin-antitoxin module
VVRPVAEEFDAEVVLATAEQQVLLAVRVEAGASVADAIEASGIASRFPGLPIEELPTGIWGKVVARDTAVRAGDRIELYRALTIDPREARRQRALADRG